MAYEVAGVAGTHAPASRVCVAGVAGTHAPASFHGESRALPPGTHRLLVLTPALPAAVVSEKILQRYAKQAVSITLAAGEQTVDAVAVENAGHFVSGLAPYFVRGSIWAPRVVLKS